jgi:hypothetical protein
MAQNNGKDPVTTKLRITGIKEPVVWIKDDKDNKPVAWMAGVGIEGLIPDLFKGYKYRYTRELISPDGEIVNTGILSQAPRASRDINYCSHWRKRTFFWDLYRKDMGR